MPTTTSSTAGSSIVTALGGGSGIDMSALATNLAAASFEGRTTRLQTRSETLDRQISAAASLKSKILGLASALGDRVRTGDLAAIPTLANPAVATASAGVGTPVGGGYSLEVTALASAQTLASTGFASSIAAVGAGSLTLRFGTVSAGAFAEDPAHAAVTVTIPSGSTLTQVAGAINAAGAGVSAYVAQTTEGAKLVLKGQEGAANGFVLEAAETPGEEGLAALAWEPLTGAASRKLASAGDAAYKLDGLAATSPSNTLANVAPGLSLKLAGTNTGAPTRIGFSDPSPAISSAMSDLAAALNEIVNELNEDVNQGGDLSADPGARMLRRELAKLAGTVVMPNASGDEPRTLADLGLATQRDGTFLVDNTRLSATLKRSPAGAAAMFTTGLFGAYATIDKLSRTVTRASDPGTLTGSVNRYSGLKKTVGEDIAKLTEKQEALRQSLLTRFAATDSRVGTSKSTLSFLQNQIDAWNAQGN